MSTLLVTYLLLRQSHALPVIVVKQQSDTVDSTVDSAWVSSPNVRGTYGLILGCLATSFLSAWIAWHPNFNPGRSQVKLLFERLLWIVAVMAAPEIVLISVWSQRCAARKLREEINELGQRAYDAEDIDTAVRSYEEHLQDKRMSTWKPSNLPRRLSAPVLNASKLSVASLRSFNAFQQPNPSHPSPSIYSHSDSRSETMVSSDSTHSRTSSRGSESTINKTIFSPWTLNDAFLAASGVFTVDSSTFWTTDTLTFTPAGILDLARAGLLPPTRPSTHTDKSKRDIIAIFLVGIQCLWFMAQFFARLSHQLPVTLLEITTITHLLCTLAIATTWARKPWNAASSTPLLCDHERLTDLAALFAIDPHISHTLNQDKNRLVYPIDITEATEALSNASFSPRTLSHKSKRDSSWQLTEDGHAKVAELHVRACRALEHLRRRHRALVIGSPVGQSPPPPSLRFVEPRVVARGRSEWRVEAWDALMGKGGDVSAVVATATDDPGYARRAVFAVVAPAAVAAALLGAVVMGVSCASSAGFFPTDVERLLWRVAGLVVIGVAVALVTCGGAWGRWMGAGGVPWKKRAVYAAGGVLGALYVVAKVFVLIEVFASLRAPSEGIYEDVAGVRWVPHVGW
ncbi:hypothetical protein BFW01_g10745 [Lasiodiplodia theobromae]|uniref:Uncharacterized protein n=1 Tax=Lasiodiplodia theobromae TaxID=45133 RepID=A0A5N5DT04_9PEZI|nr:hypothetical protein DBV05_g187 [Lasiodiplodia theobromae]KAF9629542.1 hypothetical protein BFW01_g10745 [Lasiodiplodia theobromae]